MGAALRIRRASPAPILLRPNHCRKRGISPKSGGQALSAHDQAMVVMKVIVTGSALTDILSYVSFWPALKCLGGLKTRQDQGPARPGSPAASKARSPNTIHFQQTPPPQVRSGVFFQLYNIVTASPKRVSSQIFARRRIQIPGRCTQHLTSPLSQRSCHGCKIVLPCSCISGEQSRT